MEASFSNPASLCPFCESISVQTTKKKPGQIRDVPGTAFGALTGGGDLVLKARLVQKFPSPYNPFHAIFFISLQYFPLR
jgi:hypothetical protein